MNLGQLIAAEVPDLTEEEAADLILLRKEYGISAREAHMELPAWEVHLLLSAARPLEYAENADIESDPFEAPPSDLEKLLNPEG